MNWTCAVGTKKFHYFFSFSFVRSSTFLLEELHSYPNTISGHFTHSVTPRVKAICINIWLQKNSTFKSLITKE